MLLTPGSNERPWVLFNSGIAHGLPKQVVPVTHFIDKAQVHDVFRAFEVYDGRDREQVYRVVDRKQMD